MHGRSKQSARRLQQLVRRLKNYPEGRLPNPWLVRGFRGAWANPGYQAGQRYLMHMAREAVATEDAVLECGSGLSTILLGLLAGRRGIPVVSLEHDAAWHANITEVLRENGVPNTTVLHAPLTAYEGYTWYDLDGLELPERIGMVVCDGPPRKLTPGGRYGLLPLVGGRMVPGCKIMLDDSHRSSEQGVLTRWGAEKPLDIKAFGRIMKFSEVTCRA